MVREDLFLLLTECFLQLASALVDHFQNLGCRTELSSVHERELHGEGVFIPVAPRGERFARLLGFLWRCPFRQRVKSSVLHDYPCQLGGACAFGCACGRCRARRSLVPAFFWSLLSPRPNVHCSCSGLEALHRWNFVEISVERSRREHRWRLSGQEAKENARIDVETRRNHRRFFADNC